MLKKLAAYALAAVMLLPCIPVFADNTVQSINWTTESGAVTAATTPDGALPTIDIAKLNNVKVKFTGDTTDYATLTVVPVTDGAAQAVTAENAALILQQPVSGGEANFSFYLKQTALGGKYALIVGGKNAESAVRYFSVSDRSIEWTADGKAKTLANSPSGNLSVISRTMSNVLKITFRDTNVKYASVIIVPVTEGVAEEPTGENVVFAKQQAVTNGACEIPFSLKPSTKDGIYALYTGATGTNDTVGYFQVSSKAAPIVVENQMFQYDDYKESIKLNLSSASDSDFDAWAADKVNLAVKLKRGSLSADIDPQYIKISKADKTMAISALGYTGIIPSLTEAIEGNIAEAEVWITSPGYWANGEFGGTEKRTVKLVAPALSADGFKAGVPFDIELYSGNDLSGANAIVALYDDGLLVDFVQEENISISAGETKNVSVTVQSDGLKPSGRFSLKVMLWNGTTAEPLTSFVLFP